MKRIATLGAAVLAAAFSANAVYAAPADSKSVDVSAVISGVSTVNVKTLKIADNSDSATALKLDFASVPNTVAEWSTQPSEYIKLSVIDNENGWKLKTYTDNAGPTVILDGSETSTTTWGYQYGGLVSPTRAGAKIGMGWLVNPTVIAGGPALGDPAKGRVVDSDKKVIPAESNGFTYLKDKADLDDPTQTGDQSFVGADAGGYTVVAFGDFTSARITRPNLQDGNEAIAAGSDFFYYVEGQFRGAKPASYTGKIVFDLVNQ